MLKDCRVLKRVSDNSLQLPLDAASLEPSAFVVPSSFSPALQENMRRDTKHPQSPRLAGPPHPLSARAVRAKLQWEAKYGETCPYTRSAGEGCPYIRRGGARTSRRVNKRYGARFCDASPRLRTPGCQSRTSVGGFDGVLDNSFYQASNCFDYGAMRPKFVDSAPAVRFGNVAARVATARCERRKLHRRAEEAKSGRWKRTPTLLEIHQRVISAALLNVSQPHERPFENLGERLGGEPSELTYHEGSARVRGGIVGGLPHNTVNRSSTVERRTRALSRDRPSSRNGADPHSRTICQERGTVFPQFKDDREPWKIPLLRSRSPTTDGSRVISRGAFSDVESFHPAIIGLSSDLDYEDRDQYYTRANTRSAGGAEEKHAAGRSQRHINNVSGTNSISTRPSDQGGSCATINSTTGVGQLIGQPIVDWDTAGTAACSDGVTTVSTGSPLAVESCVVSGSPAVNMDWINLAPVGRACEPSKPEASSTMGGEWNSEVVAKNILEGLTGGSVSSEVGMSPYPEPARRDRDGTCPANPSLVAGSVRMVVGMKCADGVASQTTLRPGLVSRSSGQGNAQSAALLVETSMSPREGAPSCSKYTQKKGDDSNRESGPIARAAVAVKDCIIKVEPQTVLQGLDNGSSGRSTTQSVARLATSSVGFGVGASSCPEPDISTPVEEEQSSDGSGITTTLTSDNDSAVEEPLEHQNLLVPKRNVCHLYDDVVHNSVLLGKLSVVAPTINQEDNFAAFTLIGDERQSSADLSGVALVLPRGLLADILAGRGNLKPISQITKISGQEYFQEPMPQELEAMEASDRAAQLRELEDIVRLERLDRFKPECFSRSELYGEGKHALVYRVVRIARSEWGDRGAATPTETGAVFEEALTAIASAVTITAISEAVGVVTCTLTSEVAARFSTTAAICTTMAAVLVARMIDKASAVVVAEAKETAQTLVLAAKEFRCDRPHTPTSILRNVRREVGMHLRLRDCDRVVGLRGVWLAPRVTLLFNPMEGGSLHQLIRENGRGRQDRGEEESWGETEPRSLPLHPARLVADVADSLVALHRAGIVHRDVKSHNVMVFRRKQPTTEIENVMNNGVTIAGRRKGRHREREPMAWEVKLGDLGSAALIPREGEPPLTEEVGTSGSTAPEVFSGEGYGTQADVFSLGVLAWETFVKGALDNPLCGLSGNVYRDALQRGLRPPLPAHVSGDVRSLVERCWAFEPEERPTAHEVAAQLRISAAATSSFSY